MKARRYIQGSESEGSQHRKLRPPIKPELQNWPDGKEEEDEIRERVVTANPYQNASL
jgi:hypothetical protein